MSSTRKTPVGVAPYRRGGRRGSLREKPSITGRFLEFMPEFILTWPPGKGKTLDMKDSPILGDISAMEARARGCIARSGKAG